MGILDPGMQGRSGNENVGDRLDHGWCQEEHPERIRVSFSLPLDDAATLPQIAAMQSRVTASQNSALIDFLGSLT